MIKLYGFHRSNYHNKVKMALLEKGLAFEEITTLPSQEPDYLARCPTGLIPYVEVDEGHLCESQAICEYLERRYPETPLLPEDAYARAKVLEIIQIFETYIELPTRRLLRHVLFNQPLADDIKAEVGIALDRGTPAFARVAKFSPFVAGDSFTLADCAVASHLPLMEHLQLAVFGKNWLRSLPIEDYLSLIKQRPSYQNVKY